MKTPTNNNRRTVLLILALAIVPFSFAWYLAKNPDSLRLGASNGDLVTPPLTTEFSEFSGFDPFSNENIVQLKGHWVLINLQYGPVCDAACEDVLYKSRQISLMMGKDISRIRRAVVVTADSGKVFNDDWQNDGHLLKIKVSPALQEKIRNITGSDAAVGSLLLMDPLGNLMMHYPGGFDPYKVRNDLSKLLKISQIG